MIKFEMVTKEYKDITPVENFSMEINAGETAVLSGRSGSGKSTILALAAALTRPTSGSIEINGKQVSKLPEDFASLFRRDNIGIIFQNYNLLPNLTALDNITLPLLPTKVSFSEQKDRAFSLMQRLQISDRANTKTGTLSGGEQQRVAIARALINNPPVMLADEPTSNLDAKLTATLIEIFSTMKTEGRTLLIATHDRAITESGIADRIVRMGQ
jgi:putative ABC transport system ATP-binding protein